MARFEVAVGVGGLGHGQVAVAEQQLPAALGADVLQRDQVGEDRHRTEVGARVEQHDRLAVHADRQVDAERGEQRDRPGAGRHDDGAGRDVEPSASRTPVTRPPSASTSATGVPCRIRAPARRAAAAKACAVR